MKRLLMLLSVAIVASGCSTMTPAPYSVSADNIPIEEVNPRLALDAAIQKGLIRKATPVDTQAWLNAYSKKYTLKNLPPPNVDEEILIFNAELSHTYVVLQNFIFPPGLKNENRAIFLVPNGVPYPSGDYGHSEIYDFATLSIEFTAASPRAQRMISH